MDKTVIMVALAFGVAWFIGEFIIIWIDHRRQKNGLTTVFWENKMRRKDARK